MRIVIQRVRQAKVNINKKVHCDIAHGLVVFLGVGHDDTESEIQWLVNKILNLRLFEDSSNKMNLSIQETLGEIMVVSQFTLFASCKKGNRPSFTDAATPEKAIPIYNRFIEVLEHKLPRRVQSGIFGASMEVSLINDGPVTILLDTSENTRNNP